MTAEIRSVRTGGMNGGRGRNTERMGGGERVSRAHIVVGWDCLVTPWPVAGTLELFVCL